jgi:hypothetical protein
MANKESGKGVRIKKKTQMRAIHCERKNIKVVKRSHKNIKNGQKISL